MRPEEAKATIKKLVVLCFALAIFLSGAIALGITLAARIMEWGCA